MSTRLAVGLLILHGLVTPPAAAQVVSSDAPRETLFMDPENGLSLEMAIAQALAQEPSIRAVRSSVDVARAMRVQAGLRKNLSTTVEIRAEPGGMDNQTTVMVEWPLDLFRREGREAVADRETVAAERSVADRERLLAADVRSRFGEVVAATRDLALLDELIDVARRQHDLLRSRAEEGALPPLERDLVDVELRRLEADQLLQTGRAERAMFELKRLLGVPPTAPLRVRDTLEAIVSRESTDTTTVAADAVARRTDVREAEARIAVAEAKVDRAERDGRFDVSIFGGYMRMDANFPQLGVSPNGTLEPVHGVFHNIAGGAMVSIPVFNRNQGEVAAARAERAAAEAVRDAAQLSAQAEVAIARALDQRAHEATQVYGGKARTLARQNLSVVQQSYELGRTTIFEVLAEQKRYLELERAYTDMLREAFDARTALTRARGDLQ